MKVVLRQKHRAQHLPTAHQVVQVGAGEAAAGRTAAIGIERPRVLAVAGVLQVHRAARGEGLAGAPRARRQHAVEHVDAAHHRADDVVRPADAHQVAGLAIRHARGGGLQHAEGLRLALADRQAAHGVARQVEGGQRLGRFPPQIVEHAALHDAEQRVTRALPERARAAFGPAQRQAHRVRHLVARPAGRRAFVELHRHVGVQQVLDLDRALGGERVLAAVDVALEDHALLVELPQAGQRHHLKAAAVGQDRARPGHEGVQAAQPRDPLGARAQHQVIGVGEDHLGAGGRHLVRPHGLDARGRAHGHEGRRLHRPVRGRQASAPGHAVGGQLLPAEPTHADPSVSGSGPSRSGRRCSRLASP